MKTWKRMLTALFCLCMVGAATGTMAMASEQSDRNELNRRALDYVTWHYQNQDQCMDNDLLTGTLVEYAESLDEDPAQVTLDLDGEETTLEELCKDLNYYADRTTYYQLIGMIQNSRPLLDYELSVDTGDLVLDGDYCRVELYAKRDYRYPNVDFGTGEGDMGFVEFLRLDGTWYIARLRLEGYELFHSEKSEQTMHEELEYMKAHFDELVRKNQLEWAQYGAQKFHDSIIRKTMVTAIQIFKRTVYRELGVEMQRKYG